LRARRTLGNKGNQSLHQARIHFRLLFRGLDSAQA
jgi:hypothetical protein